MNTGHLPGTDWSDNSRIVDTATPLPKRTATRRNPTKTGVGAILGSVGDESIPLQILELLETQLIPTMGVTAALTEWTRNVFQVVQTQLGLDHVLAARVALEVLWRWRYGRTGTSGTFGGGGSIGERRGWLIIGRIPIGLARSDEPIIAGADVIAACIVACSILVGNIRQNGQGRYDAAPAVTADARHHRRDFGSCAPVASSKDGTGIAGTSCTCGGFIIVNTTDTAEKALTTTTTWSCTLTAQEEGVAVGRCGGHGGRSCH